MTHTNGQIKTCDSCAYRQGRMCTFGVTEREPVHGNRVFYIHNLLTERRDTGECGPEGKQWESRWGFLKAWAGYAIIACIAMSAGASIMSSEAIRSVMAHTYFTSTQ